MYSIINEFWVKEQAALQKRRLELAKLEKEAERLEKLDEYVLLSF